MLLAIEMNNLDLAKESIYVYKKSSEETHSKLEDIIMEAFLKKRDNFIELFLSNDDCITKTFLKNGRFELLYKHVKCKKKKTKKQKLFLLPN